MTIERALEHQGWELVKREKWIAVRDERPNFQSTFASRRVGKLIGSKFYVTPTELQVFAERHIVGLGLRRERISSTGGGSREYWGFDSKGIADTVLQTFMEGLQREIQRRMQK